MTYFPFIMAYRSVIREDIKIKEVKVHGSIIKGILAIIFSNSFTHYQAEKY